jgi:CcmD family protein
MMIALAANLPAIAWAQNKAADETTITGGTLVVIAYFALWTMVLIYLAVLSSRQKRLDGEIDDLEKRLDTLLGIDD